MPGELPRHLDSRRVTCDSLLTACRQLAHCWITSLLCESQACINSWVARIHRRIALRAQGLQSTLRTVLQPCLHRIDGSTARLERWQFRTMGKGSGSLGLEVVEALDHRDSLGGDRHSDSHYRGGSSFHGGR